MSDDDFKFQYSFRLTGMGGQNSSMVNVRAGDAAAFEVALDALPDDAESGAPGLLTKLLDVDRLVSAAGVVAGTPASGQAQPVRPAQPAGDPEFIHQQPAGPPPTAPDGTPLIWKSAKKGSGKNWKGWFHPGREGDPGYIKPQFVK